MPYVNAHVHNVGAGVDNVSTHVHNVSTYVHNVSVHVHNSSAHVHSVSQWRLILRSCGAAAPLKFVQKVSEKFDIKQKIQKIASKKNFIKNFY